MEGSSRLKMLTDVMYRRDIILFAEIINNSISMTLKTLTRK